ncbi:MAG: ribonuclease HII [Bdellovibrionaceae bacterium]|nr:ribonuclease HII [Pseudobdellovibrionaceae bacterium]
MHNKTIIGVDEVGRGCLAGPVFAAAVVLPREYASQQLFKDSKLLTAKAREELATLIIEVARVGVAFATVKEIFDLNILQASLLAMKRAVEKIDIKEATVLVDGKFTIPYLPSQFVQKAVIKGDSKHQEIAAASIVAKVTRDKLLVKMARQYPQYFFEKHKGYGTKLHKEAIQKWGPCQEHRSSFKGVKEFLQ